MNMHARCRYVLERKEEDDDFWTTLPDVVSGTAHTVKGLKKGKKYKFRVRAENIYGVSDPAETDKAILAKNPYGTLPHIIITSIQSNWT